MSVVIHPFESFKLNKQLIQAIQDLHYSTPTLIQRKAIPLILGGHDVIGIAQTGTGKTAAYLLPLLMKIKYASGEHPRALILVPSKELVLQIAQCIEVLAKYTDIRHTCIYGGVGAKKQIEVVQQGIDILVATPGRFLDLYKRGVVYVRGIKSLVLDEADKMLDMGFLPQIRNILEVIPTKRQNLLFSATMPDKVAQLSAEFLEFPEKVIITPQATPVKSVTQQLYYVPNLKTKATLLALLLEDTTTFHKVMVFTKMRKTAEDIAKFLERKTEGGVRIIHANKGQNTRINALHTFKEGKVRILVATDVAARGIDISQVSHVINFEVPIIYEEYVHRIGRTGRAQYTGEAITFANEAEKYHIHQIERLIRQKIPVVPLPPTLPIAPTSFEEKQAIAREVDWQRQKEVPGYQGAFHEKKTKKSSKKNANFQKRKRR
ncbi:MAG: DEAD/DEAH box helicase [Cytophagales bacterium]|nr:DEAD/DEAH box helicase [Cytophagales bacterium]